MPRASPRRPHPGSHLLPPAAPLRLPPAAVGYAPVLLTVAPAAIAVKAIIWLTVFVMAAAVSLLWRIRRKLADATAVQLTRYPGALAQGYPTLAALDMAVRGAVAVHFLFPVWDPAVDRDHSRPEVTSLLLHMQLPIGPRLLRPERLGASAEGAPLERSDPGLTWREVMAGAGGSVWERCCSVVWWR